MTNTMAIRACTPKNRSTRSRLLLPLAATFACAIVAPRVSAQLAEDFDGSGTTPYSLANSAGPAPAVTAGGPTDSFLRLIDNSDNSNNSLAFDENASVTGPAPLGKVLSTDFRLSVDGATGVAGMGFGYAAIGPWDATGARNPGAEDPNNNWEQPSFAGTVMVGLNASPGTDSVNLNAFGSQLAEVDVQPFLDLDSGVFHRAMLTVSPNPADPLTALFDLDIIEDVHGAAVTHNVMSAIPAAINLNGLPGNRVIAGAHTEGLVVTADLDNVGVTLIPEPSSVVLSAVAAACCLLLARRRARK